MSIADKIIRLQNAKDAIASAIDEQGGLVNDGDGYEEFADDIRTIRSSSTKTDYYMLADTMNSSGLSSARTHAPHDVGPASIINITDAMGGIPFENVTVNIVPIQSGSGDPSPTNIRPITGWTGATVTRTGKNLLEPKVFTSGRGYTNPIKVDFSKYPSYTLSCNISTDICRTMIYGYSSKSDALGDVNKIARTAGTAENVRTISKDLFTYEVAGDVDSIEYIIVYFYGGNTTAQDLNNGEIQVEIGSTATTYEPYNGTVYPVTWSEAGTVYAGHYDPITGILTAEYEIINIDGSKTVYKTSAGHFYYSIGAYAVAPNERGKVSTGWCSHYKLMTDIQSTPFSALDNVTAYNNTSLSSVNGRAFFNDSRFSSSADFKNYLIAQNSAGTPVQYVYKLKIPVTYQLTPQQIISLPVINNIWADTGNMSLTYYDDTAATWVTTPPTPNAYAKYLWWYYHLAFANGDTEDSPPALIGVYNQDWHEESQLAMSAAQAAQSTANAAVASISDILTNGTTFNGAVTFASDVSYTKNGSPVSIPSSLGTIESAISSVRSRQNSNLFRVSSKTATIHLMSYAQAGQSSGVYLIILRPWTVSLSSGAVYIVSFITNDYGAATCIEPSSGTSLSISGETVTITFPNSDGGMVAILGGPII